MTAAARKNWRAAAAPLCAGAISLATAFISASGPAAASSRPDAGSRPPGSPLAAAPSGEELLTVSASSARSAWATGELLTGGTVLLHWNGRAWSRASFPDPAASTFRGVSDVAPRNAWLAGVRAGKTLILHWNGTKWSRVASPNVAGQSNGVDAVSASSAGNAWAVGSTCPTESQDCVPLMLRWNGTDWSTVASPAIGDSAVAAVKTLSATDAWAVGHDCGTGGCYEPLVMHWNGTRWSQMPLPAGVTGGLFGITATSARNAWAVGDGFGNGKTWIFHWNGTRWSEAAHPNPGFGDSLFGVTAMSRNNAWAVGYSCTSRDCTHAHTLILHWNGRAWSRVTSPNAGTGSELADVAAVSARSAWAVGDDCTVTESCAPIILRWNGTAWSKVRLS